MSSVMHVPQLLDDLAADSRRTIRRMAGGRRTSAVLRRLGLAFEAVRYCLVLRVGEGVGEGIGGDERGSAAGGSKRRGVGDSTLSAGTHRRGSKRC